MNINSSNMNKLGFNDILKQNSTLVPGKINENKDDFVKFIEQTKRKQAEVLKLKDLNSQQLKIMIKL
jgi:hypothetical protein